MQKLFSFLVIFIAIQTSAQEVPYNQYPDWESTAAGRISTGLGLADINGDGWKDMIVADGNDIQRQHLTVHYNNGDGTFALTPNWESDDIDYHGHLAVGDLNNDGWPDVAVSVYIGPSGFSDPGKLKIYYNQQGALESTPSFESMLFYTFSCAMGDADGDGDLDIGVACGEPYGNIRDKGRIYYNENGMFNDDNIWESDIPMGSMDVAFGDIDLNGYLDIIFCCERTPNYIYFADDQGQIDTTAAWVSTDAGNFINSVDVGYDLTGNPYSYIVMTGNDQLGGDGRVKRYDFNTLPYGTTPVWESDPFGYGSGILLYSMFWENQPDLIYSGWWLPVKIALKTGNGYELNTSYTSSSSSVVEAILVSDLDRESIVDTTYLITDTMPGNIIVLPHQVVESVSGISIEDVALSTDQYKHIPGKNRIAVDGEIPLYPPISVNYKHSPHGDIVISNWDNGKGNFIFFNTSEPVGIDDHVLFDEHKAFNVFPNPAKDQIKISFTGIEPEVKEHSLSILFKDPSGKTILNKRYRFSAEEGTTVNVGMLKPGFYIVEVHIGKKKYHQNLIIK
ncbi:MAG: T9SS type A sorting domain-containing protein [Bacteroidales bacterium]|nr:T9SS type A sorting domain-containing protein [Bacteroidales bacterium]MCF8377855.1 T9SS type A sorting domain-containing protein [Bacteroidales bacterium]